MHGLEQGTLWTGGSEAAALLRRSLGRLRRAIPSSSCSRASTNPVVHGPDLGLSMADLSDGSYSTTKIYPVSGTPGNTNTQKAIGDFYVQFAGDMCAYHIPGARSRCASPGVTTWLSTTRLAGTSGRALRAHGPGGNRGLSTVCGWPQPHGRQAALPGARGRLRRHRRVLLLPRQPPIGNSPAWRRHPSRRGKTSMPPRRSHPPGPARQTVARGVGLSR